MKEIRKLLFLLPCLASSWLLAGQVDVSNRLYTNGSALVVRGDSMLVEQNQVTGSFTDRTVNDVITFGINNHYSGFINSASDVRVRLKIKKWDLSNQTTIAIKYQTVNYHPFDTLNFKDRDHDLFYNCYKYLVTIDSIFINGQVHDTLPANLYLDGSINIERFYNFSATTPVSSLRVDSLDIDCDGIMDEIMVSWLHVDGAEQYQLEWGFVNDYADVAGTYLPASSLSYDFRNNGTRITTANNSYNVSLLFDHGYLLYRVRAVGMDLTSFSHYIYGVWSTTSDLVNMSTFSDMYHVTHPHEVNKNWMLKTSYAEEGKKKEVVSYFDGTLRNRQSVTKVNSDKNLIIGETIYDLQGRPAITVLPAPIGNPSCSGHDEASIKYYPKFNQDDSSHTYSFNDFDMDIGSCYTQAATMSTGSGSSKYFSSSNSDTSFFQAYVPDAGKYPMSQVEYLPDNTGRISRQGGVGPDHQLGSGHETSYWYGQPDQIMLDRMFGSEVGYAAHCKENVVLDPNGQISVSYLNKEGKTIATSIGVNPSNEYPLPSFESGGASLHVDMFNKDANGVSTTNKKNISNTGIEFTRVMLATSPGNYSFNYNFSIDTLKENCISAICFHCVYDLDLKITDYCGDNVALMSGSPIHHTSGHFTTGSGGLIEFTAACNTSNYSELDSFSVYLNPGAYTVTKKLILRDDAVNYYLNQYLDSANNPCFHTYNYYLNYYLSQIDTSSCFVDCDACLQALGTKDAFIAAGNGTALDYDEQAEQCMDQCRVTSECEANYDMMVMDMSPGGQYGQYLDVNGNVSPWDFQLSIYNIQNFLPKNVGNNFTFTFQSTWKHPTRTINGTVYPYYLDDDGSRAKVSLIYVPDSLNYDPHVDNLTQVFYDASIASYYTYPENLTHVEDFVNHFTASWAQSLVYYHPEYCYYEACKSYAEKPHTTDLYSSNSFDELLASTNTFADAVTNKFIKSDYATNTSYTHAIDRLENWFTFSTTKPYDPFVVYGVTGGVYENFATFLPQRFSSYETIAGINRSMADVSALSVRCGTTIGSAPVSACYDFGLDIAGSNSDSIRNAEWNDLKMMYLSAKKHLQQIRGDSLTLRSSCPGYNGCIGNTNFNPYSYMFFSAFNFNTFNTSNYFQPTQPCGCHTYSFYANKERRYGAAQDLAHTNQNDANYQVYLQTGQCPNAVNFQSLLSALAAHGKLDDAGEHLETYQQYAALYLSLNNYATSPPLTPLEWEASASSSDVLNINLVDNNNNVVCTGTLDKSGTPIANWDDITGIIQLHSTTGTYGFTATARIDSANGHIAYYPISGSTCYNIHNCSFSKDCEPNEVAVQLQNLMSALAINGALTGSSVNLETSTYQPFLTPVIRNTVGVPGNNLRWSYNSSSHSFSLYQNSAAPYGVKLSIASLNPSGFSYSNLSTLKVFANINSEYQNLFVVDAKDTLGNTLVTIHGSAQHFISSTSTDLAMGKCEMPSPGECTGIKYDYTTEFQELLNERLSLYPLPSSINLFESPDMTNLLRSFFSDTLTTSLRHSHTTGNFLADTITFTFLPDTNCFMEIRVKMDTTTHASLSKVTKVYALTGTGTPDVQGDYHEFKAMVQFTVTIANQLHYYIDTLYGTTCLPLAHCATCLDSFPEIPQRDIRIDSTTHVNIRDSLINHRIVTYDPTVSNYNIYVSALKGFNASMGWDTAYPYYLTPASYSKFNNDGHQFPLKEYLNFLKNYDVDVDNWFLISDCDSFICQYGYCTNATMEYNRYHTAMQKYNVRAREFRLDTLPILNDSTFYINLLADSLYLYVGYLASYPDARDSTPALNINDFYDSTGITDTLNDSLAVLYKHYYLPAYRSFEIRQSHDSTKTCKGYDVIVPRYSIESFRNQNYGCPTTGLNEFSNYIKTFSDTKKCPGPIKNIGDCVIPDKVDTASCQKLYEVYLSSLDKFNASKNAMCHGDTLFIRYKSFDDFIARGMCEWVEKYIYYLQNYILDSCSVVYIHPIPIDSFPRYNPDSTITTRPDPSIDPCKDLYVQYVQAIVAYNDFVLQNPALGYPIIDFTYSFADFIANNYCQCVIEYCAFLKSVMSGSVRDIAIIKNNIFISRLCFPTKLPCPHDQTLDTIPNIPVTLNTVDPCVQAIKNSAIGNAQHDFQNYLDSLSAAFKNRYKNHCLSTVENFHYNYHNNEHHFTLYYYDEAGNLERTIPPEGFTALGITSSSDALEGQIQSDRLNVTHSVFTNHLMASLYQYNSLDQPTKEKHPDHDLIDLWETSLPSGINSGLNITAVQFVSSSRGYLSGYIPYVNHTVIPDSVKRGYIYETNDGGKTWSKLGNLVGSSLQKVQMLNIYTGYAVGSSGVVVKTNDGGNNWDMLDLYAANITADLNDLHFISPLEGVIVGKNRTIIKTTNGGAAFTVINTTSDFNATDNITSITYDETNHYYYIAVNRSIGSGDFAGLIYKSSDGSTWTQIPNIKGADITKINYFENNRCILAGVDGRMMQYDHNSHNYKELATNMSGKFIDVYYKNISEGIAIIRMPDSTQGLYKTFNNGTSWEMMSQPGEYFNAIYPVGAPFSWGTIAVAAGNSGLLVKVILDNNTPFGMEYLYPNSTSPSVLPNFTAVFAKLWGTSATTYSMRIVAGDDSGRVYLSSNTSIPPFTLGHVSINSAPDTSKQIKKIACQFWTPDVDNNLVVSGVALTKNGELYPLRKNSSANFTDHLTPFVFPDSTNIGMADIAPDTLNNRVYAFNKTDQKLYKINLYHDSAATVATVLSSSANTSMQHCNSLAYNYSHVALAGNAGQFFIDSINAAGTDVTGSWTNQTAKLQPLPMNDVQWDSSSGKIYTAGADGTILQKCGADTFRIMPCGLKENLNAIKFNNAGLAFVAGDNLTIVEDSIGANEMFSTPITTGGFILPSSPLTDIAISGNTLYVNSTMSFVLFSFDYTFIGLYPTYIQTNQYSNGITILPGSNKAFAVGSHAGIFQFVGMSYVNMNTVFTPALRDVNFSSSTDGYTVGDHYTIRHTTDGGLSWSICLPSGGFSGAAPKLHSVWSPSVGTAVTVGDGGYVAKISQQTCSAPITTAGTSTWNLNKVMFSGLNNGYAAGGNGSSGVMLQTTNGGNSWVTCGTPVSGTSFNSVHVFGSTSPTCIAAGDNGIIKFYNGNAPSSSNYSPTGLSGVNIYGIHFLDNKNGYAVGNYGTVLRTNDPQLDNSGNLLPVGWNQMRSNDGLASQPDSSKMEIRCIDFATATDGFMGGDYADTSASTPDLYARNMHTEQNLYSVYHWYDRLGRAVVSQNSKQFAVKSFTYTLYDAIGRVSESGVKHENGSPSNNFHSIFGADVNGLQNPQVINDNGYQAWINDTSGHRTEITHTYYDSIALSNYPYSGNYLRKRVSSVTYENTRDNNVNTYQHATHYQYDVHGNVSNLAQENKGSEVLSGQGMKKMSYTYDLISGKVNTVSYQDSMNDALYLRYGYDADNRITDVYSSRFALAPRFYPGALWDHDAKYFYYYHGPLARMEIGDQKVQGCDFTYTLQGWIKGVNSNILSPSLDPGRDGSPSNPNSQFARDVFGYTLGYYNTDYKPIDFAHKWSNVTDRFEAGMSGSDLISNREPLYNGNIASMTASIMDSSNGDIMPLGTAYRYDQLNRLIAARSFSNINTSTNDWQHAGTYDNKYFNQFSYDANGNILSQKRYDQNGAAIDNLTYRYKKDANNRIVQNRLYHVNDSVGAGVYSDDLDDQGTFASGISQMNTNNNYSYDAIGELERDSTEGIQNIAWRSDGKISSITRFSGGARKNLEFDYDAMGNRIAKHVFNNNGDWEKTTFYVRDAQGNVLAVYDKLLEDSTLSYKIKERHLYGSSRLGVDATEQELIGITGLADTTIYSRTLGNKHYELTNHLGNVLTVITDKTIPHDDNSDGITDWYSANILSSTDYSPFGTGLLARTFEGNKFRYGFDDKEKDDEIKSIDFGARNYSSRIGMMLTPDRLGALAYPGLSPYSGFAGNPIANIDLEGNLILYFGGYWLGNETKPQLDNIEYWNDNGQDNGLLRSVSSHFNDFNAMFFSGDSYYGSTAMDRYNSGYESAKLYWKDIKTELELERKSNPNAVLTTIAHSMGVSYSSGFLDFLTSVLDENGNRVFKNTDFGEWHAIAAYQPSFIPIPDFSRENPSLTHQHIGKYDPVPDSQDAIPLVPDSHTHYESGHTIQSFKGIFGQGKDAKGKSLNNKTPSGKGTPGKNGNPGNGKEANRNVRFL